MIQMEIKKEYQGGNETYGPLWGTMPYVVEEEWKKLWEIQII